MEQQQNISVSGGLRDLDLVFSEEGQFTTLQLYFLRRLNRLAQLRQQQASHLNGDGLKLLDRAIFSVYCDCLDQGVGETAQAILHRLTSTAAGSEI